MIEFFSSPNQCHILPSLVVTAGSCEETCASVDAWQIAAQWLWWGVTITWGDGIE